MQAPETGPDLARIIYRLMLALGYHPTTVLESFEEVIYEHRQSNSELNHFENKRPDDYTGIDRLENKRLGDHAVYDERPFASHIYDERTPPSE
jgi:hypothetical protein